MDTRTKATTGVGGGTGSLLRVALVEDSARIRAHLGEMLQEIPNVAIAFVADTEGEAVRMLAAEAWDVVILDLQLRSGTGLGVLKAMHDWRNDAQRTAIVFTNYGFPQYRDRALALGAQHFFDKAKDLEALKGLLLQLAANR